MLTWLWLGWADLFFGLFSALLLSFGAVLAACVLSFGAAGVFNTLLTCVSFALMRWADVQVDVANAVSYALGICSSFVLGKLWVFSSKNPHWHAEALRFLIGAAACWSLQWLCFHFLLPLVGEPIAYVCGMVVYTACNYIYNKCVTFR